MNKYQCLICGEVYESEEWNLSTYERFGRVSENIEETEGNVYFCPNCRNDVDYPRDITMVSGRSRANPGLKEGDEVEISWSGEELIGRITLIGTTLCEVEFVQGNIIKQRSFDTNHVKEVE